MSEGALIYAHAQAPVRVGIAGGGTDLPVWTRERRGLCLSLAVKLYTHAVAIARPDRKVVASYSRLDTASAATEIANGLVRESALLHGWEDGFEVHTLSELPSHGSGLGVSSSIAVSLAACFRRLRQIRAGEAVEPRSGVELYCLATARDAWTVEIDRLRRPIGRQDHMAAAHGGLRLYGFGGSEAHVQRTFSAEDAEWLARHLLLVELHDGHDSRAILSGVKDVSALEDTIAQVPCAIEAIEKRDLLQLGVVLSQGHVAKRKHRGTSPAAVEAVMSQIAAGAEGRVTGFKIAGAGGGGHLVLACEPGSDEIVAGVTNLRTIRVIPDYDGVKSDGWA